MKPYAQSYNWKLYHGDCLAVLPQIESQSVDAVITDPPYPHIKRNYGIWTTEQWWELIVEGVIPQVRRILKPTGSAVFILQPNSEKVGKMRGWLWEFMAWVCREWNMVQDIWWWNTTALPCGGATGSQLTRASVKACVWIGDPDCHRIQQNVLINQADLTKAVNQTRRLRLGSDAKIKSASKHRISISNIEKASKRRGGVTPFNILPIGTENARGASHSARTPLRLAGWWTRYVVPPGGTVLDPFNGVATMGLAAAQSGASYIGIEKIEEYCKISEKLMRDATKQMRMAL